MDKNQAKKPKVSFNKGKPKSEKSYMTQEEMCNMFKDLPMFKGPPVKKRKMRVEPESSSDEEPVINHSSDSSVSEYTHDYCYSVDPHLETTHADKKQKREHLTTEIIVEIKDRHGEVKPIRCLLDTGTSATIILREFVAEGRAKAFKQPEYTTWSTMGGDFTTKRKALLEFKLPEFSTNKTVEWICHVDDKRTSDKAQYDMIIGNDLMHALQIDIEFSSEKISWDDVSIPMKHRGALNNAHCTEYLYHVAMDSPLLQQAETRQKRILDADYQAVDIDTFVATLRHLSDDERPKLAATLKKHMTLFGGGLGTLKIKPVRLELSARQ